jgi:hypothetical protein
VVFMAVRSGAKEKPVCLRAPGSESDNPVGRLVATFPLRIR